MQSIGAGDTEEGMKKEPNCSTPQHVPPCGTYLSNGQDLHLLCIQSIPRKQGQAHNNAIGPQHFDRILIMEHTEHQMGAPLHGHVSPNAPFSSHSRNPRRLLQGPKWDRIHPELLPMIPSFIHETVTHSFGSYWGPFPRTPPLTIIWQFQIQFLN